MPRQGTSGAAGVSNAFRLWGWVGSSPLQRQTTFQNSPRLKRLSALGVGWINRKGFENVHSQKQSQTPFGFGGGLDEVTAMAIELEVQAMSQTPFGFGGGLDRGAIDYFARAVVSQTPFGFGGGLDMISRRGSIAI